MSNGIPHRCDPPSGSPLLGSWTNTNTTTSTTTTQPPVEDDGIIIPSSGLLCGQVVTTTTEEPEDVITRVCRQYTIITLDNPRDAVIYTADCIYGADEFHAVPPNSCIFLNSFVRPRVLDPGFGLSDQIPDDESGTPWEDGQEPEDEEGEDTPEEEETEENDSTTEDTDGDGEPDLGVIVSDPLDCEIKERPPASGEGGATVPSSDAGTGGGETGQPGPSGVASGVVYDGPQANSMFCGGISYNPEYYVQTSGEWVKIASVGYGTLEDPPAYDTEDNQLPYTYKPNAIYIYDRAGEVYNPSDEVYSTYVIDKIIPTIYDSSGLYTYQAHRELAFETPKQTATQKTLCHDPNELVLLWDNYKNKDLAGNPGYTVIESTVTDGIEPTGYTMYSFILSDGYKFDETSYNNSGIIVEEIPNTLTPIQNRNFRFRLNGLDFQYGNYKALSDLIPRDKATIIDGGDIMSPEFFSWSVDDGVTTGYGWDSGTYRLQFNNDWLSETHTTYEHKLIPIEIDDEFYPYEITNQDLIKAEDGWFPRDSLEYPVTDEAYELKFSPQVVPIMQAQGFDVNKIFLEVVTAKSYTQNPAGVRPDGTNYLYGSGSGDMRPFPSHISTEQTKRSLFTFGPSGEFVDLMNFRGGQLVQNTPSSTYNFPKYEIKAPFELDSRGCFTDDCNDRLFSRNSRRPTNDLAILNYWNTDVSMIEIIYPSGHPFAIEAVSFNTCAPCTEISDCCPPFAVKQKNVFNDYQSFVVQGSGYVPVNFHPCTIADKIATMRGYTQVKPYPNCETDDDDNGGGDTNPPDTDESFSAFNKNVPGLDGCYAPEEELYLGKKRYVKISPHFGDTFIGHHIEWDDTQNLWKWYREGNGGVRNYIAFNDIDEGIDMPRYGWTPLNVPFWTTTFSDVCSVLMSSGGDISVVGGGDAAYRGCYEIFGTSGGKTKYEHVDNDNSWTSSILYSATAEVWRITASKDTGGGNFMSWVVATNPWNDGGQYPPLTDWTIIQIDPEFEPSTPPDWYTDNPYTIEDGC